MSKHLRATSRGLFISLMEILSEKTALIVINKLIGYGIFYFNIMDVFCKLINNTLYYRLKRIWFIYNYVVKSLSWHYISILKDDKN